MGHLLVRRMAAVAGHMRVVVRIEVAVRRVRLEEAVVRTEQPGVVVHMEQLGVAVRKAPLAEEAGHTGLRAADHMPHPVRLREHHHRVGTAGRAGLVGPGAHRREDTVPVPAVAHPDTEAGPDIAGREEVAGRNRRNKVAVAAAQAVVRLAPGPIREPARRKGDKPHHHTVAVARREAAGRSFPNPRLHSEREREREKYREQDGRVLSVAVWCARVLGVCVKKKRGNQASKCQLCVPFERALSSFHRRHGSFWLVFVRLRLMRTVTPQGCPAGIAIGLCVLKRPPQLERSFGSGLRSPIAHDVDALFAILVGL